MIYFPLPCELPVFGCVVGRYHNDAGVLIPFFDVGHEVHSQAVGKVVIEKDKFWYIPFQFKLCFFKGVHKPGMYIPLPQHAGEEVTNVLFVFYD